MLSAAIKPIKTLSDIGLNLMSILDNIKIIGKKSFSRDNSLKLGGESMESGKIDSINLAYYIINSGKYKNLNQLKLQKLLYYIQSWHLVLREEVLFNDPFEAWVHGPVSRKVWDFFKDKSYIYKEIPPQKDRKVNLADYLDEDQISIINDVLEEYGDKTPYYLENLTHSELPWIKARKTCSSMDLCTNIIALDDMKTYYESLV